MSAYEGVAFVQEPNGTWVATWTTPDPSYRSGLIGTGPTKAGAYDDLMRSDEGMRRLALANPTGPSTDPAEPGVTLKLGAIFDALLADGWEVAGTVDRYHGVGPSLGALLTKDGAEFLAHGHRGTIVGPAYAAAIEAATGLDTSTVPRS